MARRRRRPRKKQARRQQRRKPQSGATSATRASSTGTLIARGVRTLLSAVPGTWSVVGKLADFGFKLLGITSATDDEIRNSNQKAVLTEITGLGARFCISGIPIIAGSSAGVRVSGFVTPEHPYQSSIVLEAKEIRVLELELIVNPVNKTSNLGGNWSVAFSPFYTEHDFQAMMDPASATVPVQSTAARYPYSVSGSASKPLTLRYKPVVSDGYAYMWHPLRDSDRQVQVEPPHALWLGCVIITYDRLNRDSYGNFTASDFSAQVLIKGSCQLRRPNDNVTDKPYYYGVSSCGVYDCLQNTTMTMISSSNGLHYTFGFDKDSKVKNTDKGLWVQQVVELCYPEKPKSVSLTLDSMAIE